jgi:hypothetical protein
MQITELTDAAAPLRAAIALRERLWPRQPGLHVSTIIDDISEKLGWHKTDDDRELGPKEVFWEMGVAWEQTVARGLRQTVGGAKPAAYQLDGVWCSPDFRDRDRAIHEIKLGWISSRQGLDHPKFRKFEYQLLAYMWGKATETGYLHVGYVRGNYANKLTDIRSWQVQASERELRRHWQRLLQHADDEDMR